MLNWLVDTDRHLTLWLNSFNSEWFDVFFYYVTNTVTWVPLFLSLLWLMFKRQGMQALYTVVACALLIVFADQISSHVFKPLFERLRPSHDGIMQYMVHLVDGRRGGMYGFVSSHAANTFALFGFLTLVVRRASMGFALFCWAVLSSYSRIYMGLHFAGDILCGAFLGLLLGWLFYCVYLRTAYHFFVIPHHNKRTLKNGLGRMFGVWEPWVVAIAFLALLLTVVLITNQTVRYIG